jgi:hypothetical protein
MMEAGCSFETLVPIFQVIDYVISFFYTEDGGTRLSAKVDTYVPNYTVSYYTLCHKMYAAGSSDTLVFYPENCTTSHPTPIS